MLQTHALRIVLELIEQLEFSTDPAARSLAAVDRLSSLVDADLVGYQQFDNAGVSVRAALNPRTLILDPVARLQPHVATHPLIAHFTYTDDNEARRMSDICSLSEWIRSDAYQAVFRTHRLRHQLAFGQAVPGGGRHGFSFNRSGSDFSDAERELVSALAPHLLRRLEPRASDIALSLTVREREVLDLLVHEGSSRGIAARLGISTRTVHKHLEHIYARLGVKGRSEALVVALRSSPASAAAHAYKPP